MENNKMESLDGSCAAKKNKKKIIKNNENEDTTMEDTKCCFYCNESDLSKLTACEFCKIVMYCSTEHWRIHHYNGLVWQDLFLC